MSCTVLGCSNGDYANADPSVYYYEFPSDPVLIEQWVQVCGWRSEQIDLATARICSLHFEDSCYKVELKIIDYITCCTKVLKYDAVPTLYLPTAQIVIKHEDLREMILFTVPENAEVETDSNTIPPGSKEYLQLHVQHPAGEIMPEAAPQQPALSANLPVITEQVSKPELEPADIAKYKHIRSRKQLLALEARNRSIREKLFKIESNVKQLKNKLANNMKTFREKDLELSKLNHEYNQMKSPVLSLLDQKLLLAKVFSESQIKILSGKKKIYWSNDDMAVGYTIRHLSNKRCYIYLTKKLNIPLPAVSSIKRWMTLKSSPKKAIGIKVDAPKEEENSD